MSTPAPIPLHTLRTHRTPLSALHFGAGNALLYAGDQDGWVSVTDTRARRAVCFWRAHDGGILGLEEWDGQLITQGRDNLVHIHSAFGAGTSAGAGTSTGTAVALPGLTPTLAPPRVAQTLHSNALNFCRFALAPIPSGTGRAAADADAKRKGKGKGKEALLVLPNLVDSELADVYHLPTLDRIHTAINYASRPKTASAGQDGRVEVWACRDWGGRYDGKRPGEDPVWARVWKGKGHNEAVMGMAVDRTFTRAFTVSADHMLCRYDLVQAQERGGRDVIRQYPMKQIGNASVAVSADGLVVAVGGWDGRIRLFSAATTKPLGTLVTHRETVHVLAFAAPAGAGHPAIEGRGGGDGEAGSETKDAAAGDDSASTTTDTTVQPLDLLDSDSDSDEDGAGGGLGEAPRARWLASGGKDTKVAIWALKDFRAGP
ncbi:Astra associated protein 1 Asa1 [Cryptotrichosporon argae]